MSDQLKKKANVQKLSGKELAKRARPSDSQLSEISKRLNDPKRVLSQEEERGIEEYDRLMNPKGKP